MSRTISQQLRDTLARLRASPVAFSPEQICFVHTSEGGKLRGLNPILARLLPVPVGGEELPAVRPRARRSRNDPDPDPDVWRHPCTAAPGLRLSLVAHSCTHALGQSRLPRVLETAGADKQHGVLLDEQLKLYVAGGWSHLCAHVGVHNVDPCVATLLDCCRAKRLVPVASQLPLYSPAMHVATAIDLVCTDRETLSQFHLIELKASMAADRERGDRNYERLRGRLTRTALRGTPLSYYGRHQVQLWTMHHMLGEMARPPTSARVMRVSPGVVRDYALNDWYSDRTARFVRAIGAQTGAKKRAAKRRRLVGAPLGTRLPTVKRRRRA